jgi:50S ribosomal subunit-associated GTPase HflX
MYLENASAILIVVDATNLSSFSKIASITASLSNYYSTCKQPVPHMVLACSKSDKVTESSGIDVHKIRQVASQNKLATGFLVSSSVDDGIDEMFSYILKIVHSSSNS